MAVAWGFGCFGCFGMSLVVSSTSVLLLKPSAPEEAGTDSAALQISDGLSNVATGSRPAAFAVVFLPMAGVALVGAWVATRVRKK
ncbi:Multidrug resistance efflux protein [Streptomyces ambofaciens ATCC 23877]|uniref:Multidrug resistance efflux protein n=1 Tax=Streptomyces ambofaciens (strain ATCC 23877 / 3486 / DSM 40053 / JCM 4204 / NBRC 12836 / NRRL B-2516) TaxID=278992 RepID=A0A0K2AST6_STRA7|nr:Multidrug resistance efflux protein [Streptomyces ambofaciens ATCC 23877]